MSGPVLPIFRPSVHTAWIRPVESTAMSGWVWKFAVMSFTRTFAEKLRPPSVDFEKKMSWFPFRLSVQAT